MTFWKSTTWLEKQAQRINKLATILLIFVLVPLLAMLVLTSCEEVVSHVTNELIDPDDEEPCTLPPGLCGQEEDLVEEATKAEYRRQGVPHRDSSWVSRPASN